MATSESICRRYFVGGKVQGVWFRSATRERALELGLSGYARNLADGRVEVLAFGAREALQELEVWLWRGSPAAVVSEVTPETADGAEAIPGRFAVL